MTWLAHVGPVPVEELAFAAPAVLLALGALRARLAVAREARRRAG